MVKYFMKVVVLFIIFSVFFITSNSSFILINNASAYEKENYGSSAKKDFDKKKYENNISEYNNLGKEKKETEIAYFGLLEEFQNKKLGSYLLSEAIKKSFLENINRVWLHTCSLDHKNALNNYISRGMKIFKTETVIV